MTLISRSDLALNLNGVELCMLSPKCANGFVGDFAVGYDRYGMSYGRGNTDKRQPK